MARHGIKLNSNSWKTMKGPGDFDPPECDEDHDGPECPECDGEMEETESGTWKGREWANFSCCDEDCDGSLSGEPDWGDIVDQRSGRYDY